MNEKVEEQNIDGQAVEGQKGEEIDIKKIPEESEVIIEETGSTQSKIEDLGKEITAEEDKSIVTNELENIEGDRQEAISTFNERIQEEEKDEIEIQNEEWMQQGRQERESDVRTTSDKYRNDLGVEAETDLEQEQENARTEALKLTEELVAKEKVFMDWIEKGANLNPENPEEINAYLRGLAEQLKQYSNILKYDYLKAENQGIDELIDREHFIRVMSIEKLEDLERLANKGIENWTEADIENSKGLIDWLKELLPMAAALGSIGAIINKIMNYMTALHNSGLPIKALHTGLALKAMSTVGMGKAVPFGFLALIYALTTEEQRDKFMVALTGKKVYWGLGHKKEKKS